MRKYHIILVNLEKEQLLAYTTDIVPIVGDTISLKDGDDMYRVTERMLPTIEGSNIVLVGYLLVN